MKKKVKTIQKTQSQCGFGYFLGIVGSAVFFIQQVHGFWPVVLALLKAFVWPAFLTLDLFKYLAR